MERPVERTSARTAVVWETVRGVLAEPSTVLDIGGGTGGLAVRLAAADHTVTVVDPSPDALAALARRAAEQGVAERVTGVQGDLSDLSGLSGLSDRSDRSDVAGLVEAASIDLVLCHNVLGLVGGEPERAAALAAIARVLRPGGTLSLLVAQRHSAVLARAMAGHLVQARAVLDGHDETEHRFTAPEVTGLLEAAGLTLAGLQAVRVFTDLVPGSLLDLEAGAGTALLELERAVAGRPEYLTVAAQVHVLATR